MQFFEKWLDRVARSKWFGRLCRWQVKRGDKFRGRCHGIAFDKKKTIIFSLIMATVLSVTCYVMENLSVDLLGKSWLYYLFEKPFKPKEFQSDQQVAFINVSHDRQLVNLVPGDSILGNIDITDRKALLTFLQRLEQEKVNYEYILLDLRFEKGLETEVDSLLFDQILHMRKIVIATHDSLSNGGYEIADPRLLSRAGRSDYKQFGIASDFSRYTFLQDGEPSLALKMYDEVHGRTSTSIRKVGKLPLYVAERRLCVNSPMIFISGNVYNENIAMMIAAEKGRFMLDPDSDCFYQDLGADFLNIGCDLKADLDNKYIVIADFERDTHDTYVGNISGAYITWMAFQYLMKRLHLLSWSFVILYFCIYLLIVLMLFYINKQLLNPNYANNLAVQTFCRWFRWLASIFLLYIVTFLAYDYFQVRYNVTIPILFIMFTNFVIKNANRYEKDHPSLFVGNTSRR